MPAPDLSAALDHHRAGRMAEAEQLYRAHLSVAPDDVLALYNLGLALAQRAASVNRPARATADILSDLATNLFELGAVDRAIEIYRSAIAQDAQHAMAHMGCGMALLAQGRLVEGWPEYEWRRRVSGFAEKQVRFAAPEWDGRPAPGERILLHAEQGYGDTLQFLRYAPLLRAQGATVIFGCQPPLKRLLARVSGINVLLAQGEPIPPHDRHAPLLSLPGLLGTELASIPGPVGYVTADPGDIEARRRQMAALGRPRVGVLWQGNLQNKLLRGRSTDLSLWAPLLQQTGVSFVSLQPDSGRAQLADLPPALRPFDPFAAAPVRDFADTAAVMADLDLIIAIDTAGAHLAGAMGRPVWVLLPFAADWRWLRERDDSPWYPTMRLFRQRRPGDWPEVLERLRWALAAYAHAKR